MKSNRDLIVKSICLPRTPEMQSFTDAQHNFSASIRALIIQYIYEHGTAALDVHQEYEKQLHEQVYAKKPLVSPQPAPSDPPQPREDHPVSSFPSYSYAAKEPSRSFTVAPKRRFPTASKLGSSSPQSEDWSQSIPQGYL